MALDDVLAARARAAGRARRSSRSPAASRTRTTRSRRPDGRYVVRISGKDTGLLAIDRENEVHNTRRAAETGVGAPVRRRAARARRARARVPRRRGDGRREAAPRRPARARSRRRAGGCTAGGGSSSDFDMFEIQRGYVRGRAGARLPAARPLPRVRAAGARARARDARAARADGAVQQRPARGELHRRRRRDAADRLRVLRATTSRRSSSGTSGASRTSRSRSSTSWSPHYYGAAARATRSRARGSGA